MKTRYSKITAKLKNRDVFGQKFGLTYAGSSRYNTWCGSVASNFLSLIMLAYTVIFLIKVFKQEGTGLIRDEK